MKKTYIFFVMVLIFAGKAYCQPKWSFSLQGSYDMPVSDLKGTLPDTIGNSGIINFTIQRNYFTTKGFGIGGMAKYGIDTSGQARLTGGFYFNSFSQSKDYSRPTERIRTYSNRINMISFIAGAEYNLRPMEKVDPFVSLELAANFFSGKIEASGDTSITINRKSETRFGINVNAGMDIKLKKNLSLLLGAKLCMNNLFGKSFETITATSNKDTNPTGTGSTPYELPLNDGDHGQLQSLSINNIQFYAGISFDIGSVKEPGK